MANIAIHAKATPRWLPYLVLAAALVIMSLGAIFVRLAQAEHMPSLVIATLRYGCAVLLLSPYVLLHDRAEIKRLTRRDGLFIGLAGAAFSFALFSFFTSLENTTVLISNLFTNTSPLYVALMEVLILKTLLSRQAWLGIIMALAGGALFALAGLGSGETLGANPLAGVALALGSALLSSVYYIVGRLVRPRVSTPVYLWLMLLVGFVILLVITLVTSTPLTGYAAKGYVWVLLVTITGQLLGQAMLIYCLAHLPATFVSVSMLGQVILSAVLAFIVFKEAPGPVQIVASGVILAGVMTVITSRNRSG